MNGAAPPPDRSAFMRLIGAAQVPAPPGKVHVRLPHMREELLNQLPAAHGGVIMTLLDSVMSRACALQPGAPSLWCTLGWQWTWGAVLVTWLPRWRELLPVCR